MIKDITMLKEAPAIGVWKPEFVNGNLRYVRDRTLFEEWHYWANVDRIEPKGGKKRILFLGESVARGYFYEPTYTPALVLQEIVNEVYEEGMEIIDLARTNLKFEDLVRMSESCVTLDPDVMVVFAGNNWSADLLEYSEEEIEIAISTIEKEGIDGLKQLLEGYLESQTKNLISFFDDLGKANNFKIIVVIPEFNLVDWEFLTSFVSLTRMDQHKIDEWKEALEKRSQALNEQNYLKLGEIADTLINLDQTNFLGFYTKAYSLLHQDNHVEARKYFEQARDLTLLYQPIIGKPRIFSAIQDSLRKQIDRSEVVEMVDLPHVFTSNYPEHLPDRKLFLDYCHLTSDGIQLAMSEVAQVIMRNYLGYSDRKAVEAIAKKIVPTQRVSALAHVFAAIHNAHCGQGFDILLYHCRQAIELDRTVAELLIWYLELTCLQAPNNLCKAYEKILKFKGLSQYIDALNIKDGSKILDIDLANAICQALSENSEPLYQNFSELRKSEHAVNNFTVDLLESYYASTYYETDLPDRVNYYQSRNPTSKFTLISDQSQDLKLYLTARLPMRSIESLKQKNLEIYVNDQLLNKVPVDEKWIKNELKVPSAHLKDGANTIRIDWPLSPKKVEVKDSSFKTIFDFITPVIGEIHCFKVSVMD